MYHNSIMLLKMWAISELERYEFVNMLFHRKPTPCSSKMNAKSLKDVIRRAKCVWRKSYVCGKRDWMRMPLTVSHTISYPLHEMKRLESRRHNLRHVVIKLSTYFTCS